MKIFDYLYLPSSQVRILFSNQNDYHIDSRKDQLHSCLYFLSSPSIYNIFISSYITLMCFFNTAQKPSPV